MTRLLIILTSILFFACGLYLLYTGYGIVQKAEASDSWPTTQGLITESYVKHSYDDDDGNTYSAEITYEYIVKGRQYIGNQTTSLEVSTNRRSDAEAIVEKYKQGHSVLVYYNPTAPKEALLEPGVQSMTWLLAILGGAFVLVSCTVFIAALIFKGL